MIAARIHSDDMQTQARFDAEPWFASKETTDERIEELAFDNWRGPDADEIAHHCHERHGSVQVKRVFDYLTKYQPKKCGGIEIIGFEVIVIEREAMLWLRDHREKLWNHLRVMIARNWDVIPVSLHSQHSPHLSINSP